MEDQRLIPKAISDAQSATLALNSTNYSNHHVTLTAAERGVWPSGRRFRLSLCSLKAQQMTKL